MWVTVSAKRPHGKDGKGYSSQVHSRCLYLPSSQSRLVLLKASSTQLSKFRYHIHLNASPSVGNSASADIATIWPTRYRCLKTKKTLRKGTFLGQGSAQHCHCLGRKTSSPKGNDRSPESNVPWSNLISKNK